MQKSVVITLMLLAYCASQSYICAIWLMVEALGELAAKSVTKSTLAPLGENAAMPENFKNATATSGNTTKRKKTTSGSRL